MPFIHGTSAKVAEKIMQTGFASLSILDAGFYGKGMYFSSSALYCCPYIVTKQDPVLLVCLVSPGNPFPVIVGPKEQKNFLGAPINSGHQSHYVLTQINGLPITKGYNSSQYDEIVIPKESQICPIFLVIVDKAQLKPIIQKYQREVVINDKRI